MPDISPQQRAQEPNKNNWKTSVILIKYLDQTNKIA